MNKNDVPLCENVLYTIAEVASLLKVNKNMVYDLINGGYLKSIKFGCRKVTRKAILEFLDQYDGQEICITSTNEGKDKRAK